MRVRNKKLTVATAFILGTLVFVSAAFADMAVGSGYDNLKNSVKHTAAVMETELNSFTTEIMFTLKSNGKDVTQNLSYVKVDNTKNATEEKSTQLLTNGEKTENYSYYDSSINISKSSFEDIYYVTEYGLDNINNHKAFNNPFNEDIVPELEKIMDALVGSLKDYVQVQENTDGSKQYLGSLNETQIPAIANAISAFLFKSSYGGGRYDENSPYSKIEKDIFIKSVTGKAVENKDGVIENVTASITVSGIDKNGVTQELSVEVVMKVSDINNTVVIKPDLTGKEIQKYSADKFGNMDKIDAKYIGSYKNDIIIEKDGKLIKIGERNLVIAHAEENSIAGRYYELVKPEYDSYFQTKYDFTFDFNPNVNNYEFTYKNSSGQIESGHLNMAGVGKLYFDLNVQSRTKMAISNNSSTNVIYDGVFNRVFE